MSKKDSFDWKLLFLISATRLSLNKGTHKTKQACRWFSVLLLPAEEQLSVLPTPQIQRCVSTSHGHVFVLCGTSSHPVQGTGRRGRVCVVGLSPLSHCVIFSGPDVEKKI